MKMRSGKAFIVGSCDLDKSSDMSHSKKLIQIHKPPESEIKKLGFMLTIFVYFTA